MIDFLYLLTIIVFVSGQSIVRKVYTQKTDGKGVLFYNAVTAFFAMAFFLATATDLKIDYALIPYSIAFSVSFFVTVIFMDLAIANGPLSLTSLFTSFSLLLPTAYGIIALKDPIGDGLLPGLALLALSILLVNYKNEDGKLSWKWIVYVLLSFVGNGMCSVTQKIQQIDFNGAYKNEFMVLAFGIASAPLFLGSVFTERRNMKHYAKAGGIVAPACGLMVGAVNLLVMVLSEAMPVSLMFPLISAGGILLTFFISSLLYKERFSKLQYIGLLAGVASVILLNI